MDLRDLRASPRCTKPALALVNSLWEIEYLGLETEKGITGCPEGRWTGFPDVLVELARLTPWPQTQQIKTLGRGPVVSLCEVEAAESQGHPPVTHSGALFLQLVEWESATNHQRIKKEVCTLQVLF